MEKLAWRFCHFGTGIFIRELRRRRGWLHVFIWWNSFRQWWQWIRQWQRQWIWQRFGLRQR
jgi:hypothetical protein